MQVQGNKRILIQDNDMDEWKAKYEFGGNGKTETCLNLCVCL